MYEPVGPLQGMAHREDTDRSIPWIARMLLDTGPAGVALLEGPDFVCTYLNASYQAMAPSRAMLGRPVARVWPEIASRIVPALQQARDTGHPLEVMEWRLDVARNGVSEAAWFTFLFHPLAARPGEPAPLAVHAIDRTGAVLARARVVRSRGPPTAAAACAIRGPCGRGPSWGDEPARQGRPAGDAVGRRRVLGV